jgi:hypothetical protein
MNGQASLSLLSKALWLGRILFACRVSVLSAAAGFLLYALVPQARDLFSDITLGALPFSIGAWLLWALFFFYLFFVWAFPVHFGARKILETKVWMVSRRIRDVMGKRATPACAAEFDADLDSIKAQLATLMQWTPRVLGVLPFVAVYFGLYRAYRVVGDAQAFEAARDARTQIFILAALNLFVGLLFLSFVKNRRGLMRRFSPRALLIATIISFVATIVIFFLSYFAPAFQSLIAPRALIVPFLFGSLVLFATLLVWFSERVGVPFLLIAVLAAFGVTARNTTFNDLRQLQDDPPNLAQRQIEIGKAIEKWKAANGCAGEEACPPALIVAAEGGASRAAFAAATALGYLFDAQHQEDVKSGNDGPLAASRRVFAISGVSGGAFGAATIRTALWESLQRGGTAPPCQIATGYWFRGSERDAKSVVAQSWRACLQELVSGDYLTPAFVGLGFRDNLSPPAYLFFGPTLLKDDRAALVEKAWERYFDHIVFGEEPKKEDLLADKESNESRGLRRPFGYVAQEMEKHSVVWTPLLLLNGTSVDRGARIIASDLVSTKPGDLRDGQSGGRAPLYPAAFDLFEMLSNPCPPDQVENQSCTLAHSGVEDKPAIRDGANVRLSTTAMLSARFPVVSPAGTIRAKGDEGRDGDRVVDGGYFENAGLTTALDVAEALRDQRILPIVLWVQNNPTISEKDLTTAHTERRAITIEKTDRSPQFPPRAASTPRMQGAEDPSWISNVFSIFTAPFEALTATRDGHALEAADLIQQRLEKLNRAATCVSGNCRIGMSYFTFQMFKNPEFEPNKLEECAALAKEKTPIMSEVSMSWWLSQTVQAELNSQICDRRNQESLDNLVARLGQRVKLPPAAP